MLCPVVLGDKVFARRSIRPLVLPAVALYGIGEFCWPPKADLGAAIQCAYDIQCALAGNLMPQRILGDQGVGVQHVGQEGDEDNGL